MSSLPEAAGRRKISAGRELAYTALLPRPDRYFCGVRPQKKKLSPLIRISVVMKPLVNMLLGGNDHINSIPESNRSRLSRINETFSNFLYYFFYCPGILLGHLELCSLELGRLVTVISTPRQVERACVVVYKVGL
jgi:hypothetical protein